MTTCVHFVGSIGLDTTAEIFSTVGGALAGRVRRCPDGEVGGRRLWITWQWPLLRASPYLEVDMATLIPGLGVCRMRVRPGTRPADIEFGELGYAREARASYQDFLAARAHGHFPTTTRFQVSLPTPYAVIQAFVVPDQVALVLPAYEAAMLREVALLCDAIPHRDLAIQWDVCTEMLTWDGRNPHLPKVTDMERVFRQAFGRLCGAIPPAVENDFHLCYGDLDAEHSVQPTDLGKAVGMVNLLLAASPRQVNWIHMPVPRGREDDAYFAPLESFRGVAPTELYLGLVHAQGGAEAARRKMVAAARYVQGFGIATECGIARSKTPETVRTLIRIHAEAAASFDGG